jgi:hypothetical protein
VGSGAVESMFAPATAGGAALGTGSLDGVAGEGVSAADGGGASGSGVGTGGESTGVSGVAAEADGAPDETPRAHAKRRRALQLMARRSIHDPRRSENSIGAFMHVRGERVNELSDLTGPPNGVRSTGLLGLIGSLSRGSKTS